MQIVYVTVASGNQKEYRDASATVGAVGELTVWANSLPEGWLAVPKLCIYAAGTWRHAEIEQQDE